MDTFDVLMDEVSRTAQTNGVAFDEALTLALTDTIQNAGNSPEPSGIRDQNAAHPDIAHGAQTVSAQSGADGGGDSNNLTKALQIALAGGVSDPALLVTIEHLVMAVKAIVPIQMDAILTQASWADSGIEELPFVCRYENPIFTENKRADMYVAPRSAQHACAAGMYPATDTQDGYVMILARKKPESDLSVTFVISAMLEDTYAEKEDFMEGIVINAGGGGLGSVSALEIKTQLDRYGADIQKLFDERDAMHEQIERTNTDIGSIITSGLTTIPAKAWMKTDAGSWSVSAPVAIASEDHVPIVVVSEDSAEGAFKAGMELVCEAVNGEIIIYSDDMPLSDLTVTITLLKQTMPLEVEWGEYL